MARAGGSTNLIGVDHPTFGAKSAAQDPRNTSWQPIKSFVNDAPNRVHQLMDSDRLDAATLGDKLAALDSKRFDRWQPIKSFLNDDTEIGLNRMVDAMSSFGVDGVTDWNAMSMNGIARNASEHLAANHDSRTPGRYLTEFRSVIE